MTPLAIAELILGAVVVWVMLNDLFNTVVVPRSTPGRWRPGGLMVRNLWRVWRGIGTRFGDVLKRERFLSRFAPLALVLILALWVAGLVFGYGLMLDALAYQLRPAPENLGTSMYFSALSLLTLGFGPIVAIGPAARALVLMEAATGLGTVALTISFLFSLFASFQKRETLIITLDASAGAPPSGVTLLETCKLFDIPGELERIFIDWRMWSAEVLESHLAYPILNFFRSSHDNESWVSALGAVLDAATLVITTLDEGPRGMAKLAHQVGGHLVEDLGHFLHLEPSGEPGVERFEFDAAIERLRAAGYAVRDGDAAWLRFAEKRSSYASVLNQLAHRWAIPPAQWIGDRSYLRHGERQPRRAPVVGAPAPRAER